MATPLFTLAIRSRRDLIVLRQRSRQLAGLLGLADRGKANLAAQIFDIAYQSWKKIGPVSARLQAGVDGLQIIIAGPSPQDTVWELPLPARNLHLATEDLVWTIQALSQLTPFDVFEEVLDMNRELLRSMGHEKAVPAPRLSSSAA
jgi:hypothetical protein